MPARVAQAVDMGLWAAQAALTCLFSTRRDRHLRSMPEGKSESPPCPWLLFIAGLLLGTLADGGIGSALREYWFALARQPLFISVLCFTACVSPSGKENALRLSGNGGSTRIPADPRPRSPFLSSIIDTARTKMTASIHPKYCHSRLAARRAAERSRIRCR